jgi:hypothetical protein
MFQRFAEVESIPKLLTVRDTVVSITLKKQSSRLISPNKESRRTLLNMDRSATAAYTSSNRIHVAMSCKLTVRSHCNTNKRYITSEGKSYPYDSPPPSPDQLDLKTTSVRIGHKW